MTYPAPYWYRRAPNGARAALHLGACESIRLPPASIDMILTGPPGWPATHAIGGAYEGGTLGSEASAAEYAAHLATTMAPLREALQPAGSCWLVTEDARVGAVLVSVSALVIQAMCAGGWRLRGEIIVKETGLSYTPVRKVLIFGDAPVSRGVWDGPSHRQSVALFHEFDEAFVARCIEAGTMRGYVVCDPFAGRGSVGVVAQRLDRHFVGIEPCETSIAAAAEALSQERSGDGEEMPAHNGGGVV